MAYFNIPANPQFIFSLKKSDHKQKSRATKLVARLNSVSPGNPATFYLRSVGFPTLPHGRFDFNMDMIVFDEL